MRAVILSVDEITLALFPEGAGELLDTYVERAEGLLFRISLDIVRMGIDVILDWGFWTREKRDYARQFYKENGVACELHYLEVPDRLWQQRIAERDRLVENGSVSAYYVDKGLAEKCLEFFQVPDENEIDKIIRQEC